MVAHRSGGAAAVRTRALRLVAAVGVVALLAGCALVDRSTGKPVTKVVVFGDSIMWGASTAIAKPFNDQGVDVKYYGAPATGPLWNDKMWLSWLDQVFGIEHPDLVIFQSIGGAYPGPTYPDFGGGQLYVNADGVTVQPDTDLFFSESKKASQELVDLARSRGASVWWAVAAPALPAAAQYGATAPDRINRLLADQRTLDVPLIDWGAALAGHPTSAVYDTDGLHMLDAGNALIGPYTYDHAVRVATPPSPAAAHP